jgi:hypothetical protein
MIAEQSKALQCSSTQFLYSIGLRRIYARSPIVRRTNTNKLISRNTILIAIPP